MAHLSGATEDARIAIDCCWQDNDCAWWNVDVIDGVAYTYCVRRTLNGRWKWLREGEVPR